MVRRILILGIAGILSFNVPTISIKAMAENNLTEEYQEQEEIFAYSLSTYCISISASGYKTLCIDAITKATEEAQSIGIKNVTIERSPNGRDNWAAEKGLGDMLASNTNLYSLEDYSVSVDGGYFYRVTCTHYAKAKGLLGSSESEYNVSNIIWIGN